jgi:hypothetical protein
VKGHGAMPEARREQHQHAGIGTYRVLARKGGGVGTPRRPNVRVPGSVPPSRMQPALPARRRAHARRACGRSPGRPARIRPPWRLAALVAHRESSPGDVVSASSSPAVAAFSSPVRMNGSCASWACASVWLGSRCAASHSALSARSSLPPLRDEAAGWCATSVVTRVDSDENHRP